MRVLNNSIKKKNFILLTLVLVGLMVSSILICCGVSSCGINSTTSTNDEISTSDEISTIDEISTTYNISTEATKTIEETNTVEESEDYDYSTEQDFYEEPVYTPEYEGSTINLGTFTLTAYCHCYSCNGEWAYGPTATGTMPQAGRTIAVDPNVIPYGTRVLINGNVYVAEDCGGGIIGNRIDVFFDSHSECDAFGVQSAEVSIYV